MQKKTKLMGESINQRNVSPPMEGKARRDMPGSGVIPNDR